jgi:hypothetical protein
VGVCDDGDKAGERMMGQLERRAEAISGEFCLQELDKTVSAFATMGRKPGEILMGHLMELRESVQPPSHSPLHPCDHGIVVIPRFTRGKSIWISPSDSVHTHPFDSSHYERDR